MSVSSEGEANAIYFIDEPNVLSKKVMRAVTDTGPTEKNQQKPEAIENLREHLDRAAVDRITGNHFIAS